MVTGALRVAPGNFLLYAGVILIGMSMFTKYFIAKAEEKNKKVNRYWVYYKNKLLILGILFVLFGVSKIF